MADFSCPGSPFPQAAHRSIPPAELLDQSKAFIDSTAFKYCRDRIDVEDLKQVGRIAVWRAAQGYDPERGVPVEHYVRRSICNAIRSELRSHLDDRQTLLLDIPCGDMNVDSETLQADQLFECAAEDSVVLSAASTELVQVLFGGCHLKLTQAEANVLQHLYGNDSTVQEAAIALGTSHQNVSKLHRKAIQKCRDFLGVVVH